MTVTPQAVSQMNDTTTRGLIAGVTGYKKHTGLDASMEAFWERLRAPSGVIFEKNMELYERLVSL